MPDDRRVFRVAVVGLGAAGIGQIKQLLDAFDRPEVRARTTLQVVGFEARSTVGGVWCALFFPGLPYQTVPFPLFELQSRLVALHWAGLLPDLPERFSPPLNTLNPAVAASEPAEAPHPETEPTTPPTKSVQLPADGAESEAKPLIRQIYATRREFVFPNPYEWAYSRYIMSLIGEVDKGAEAHWRDIEGWREARRADTTLRERTLGY